MLPVDSNLGLNELTISEWGEHGLFMYGQGSRAKIMLASISGAMRMEFLNQRINLQPTLNYPPHQTLREIF